MHEPIRQVIVLCDQESPGESYVGVKRRSHAVPALGVGQEVRRPRAQVEEGPKPRYTNPRSYSLLGISKLIKRET